MNSEQRNTIWLCACGSCGLYCKVGLVYVRGNACKGNAFTSLNYLISTFLNMNFILKQKHLTEIFTRFQNAVLLKTKHRRTASLTALRFYLLCTLFTASWYLKRLSRGFNYHDTVGLCLSALCISEF
jgi:hypothetical protein